MNLFQRFNERKKMKAKYAYVAVPLALLALMAAGCSQQTASQPGNQTVSQTPAITPTPSPTETMMMGSSSNDTMMKMPDGTQMHDSGSMMNNSSSSGSGMMDNNSMMPSPTTSGNMMH